MTLFEQYWDYGKQNAENATEFIIHPIEDKAQIALKQSWLDKEEEASQFREQEKNTAFEMLSKYFFNLWD